MKNKAFQVCYSPIVSRIGLIVVCGILGIDTSTSATGVTGCLRLTPEYRTTDLFREKLGRLDDAFPPNVYRQDDWTVTYMFTNTAIWAYSTEDCEDGGFYNEDCHWNEFTTHEVVWDLDGNETSMSSGTPSGHIQLTSSDCTGSATLFDGDLNLGDTYHTQLEDTDCGWPRSFGYPQRDGSVDPPTFAFFSTNRQDNGNCKS